MAIFKKKKVLFKKMIDEPQGRKTRKRFEKMTDKWKRKRIKKRA